MTAALVCLCGHTLDYHEHYRAGSDCCACPCPEVAVDRHPARAQNVLMILLPVAVVLIGYAGFRVLVEAVLTLTGNL